MLTEDNVHIIVDLDGTICDNRIRAMELDPTDKNSWTRFFQRCEEDIEITPIADWIRTLSLKYHIDIITGRPEYVRKRTVNWLKTHSIHFERLLMREESDRQRSYDYKRNKLQYMVDHHPEFNYVLAFEDDDQCIKMYQSYGIKVIDAKQFTDSHDVSCDLTMIRDR